MSDHETVVPSFPDKPGTSRRVLLASGLALTVAGSLLGSRANAAPRARQDDDADPPTPLELLQAFSDASNPQQMLAHFPQLLITPFINLDTAQSILATRAALDVCELQRQAGLQTVGLQFIDAFVRDEILQRQLVTVSQGGAIMWELLTAYGVSDSEIDAAMQHPTFVSQLPQVDGRAGLMSATQSKIAALRANAGTHVAAAPHKCALLVVGATLSSTALAALQDGNSTDAALINAWVGVASTGVALAALP